MIVPAKSPGALGIDLRSNSGEIGLIRALDMNNLDIFPATDPAGSRIGPRRWARRWGQVAKKTTTAQGAAGALTGSYVHQYIWTDGSGRTHWSNPSPSLTIAARRITVSGWGTTGTVDIYRSTSGGGTPYKLVTAALDCATNPTYTDNTVDGALGADIAARPSHMDPFGNDLFTQTVDTEAMIQHRDASETYRILSMWAEGSFFRATIDSSDNPLRECDTYTNAGAPVSVALLGDLIWATHSGGLAWGDLSDTTNPLTTASQPSQPTISSVTPAGVGALTVVTGWSYVIQCEHPTTGIRSIPSAPVNTGAFAGAASVSVAYTGITTGSRVHIYRTSDGGSFYQYVGEDVGGASPYTDTTPDSGLSQQTVPFEVGAPGKFRFVWAHKGILFVANKIDSTDRQSALVRWSSSLFPHNFPNDVTIAPDYEFKVDPDDGDEITGGFSWGEVSVVFKRRRVYLITGDPPTGFRWTPVPGSRDKGCVAARTIVETSIGLVWLSPAGVCVMSSPGAPPQILSDNIREAIIEQQRAAEPRFSSTLTREPAELVWDYTCALTAGETIQVQIQLDDDSAFGSVGYDYETTDAAEIPYFLANNAPFPAAGFALSFGQRVRISVRPPSGGPAAGTTYYARYRVRIAGVWGDWTTLGDIFRRPDDDPYHDAIDVSQLVYSFAVHYPPRREVWFGIPTGGRKWADTLWILQYGALEGESSNVIWRRVTMPVSCACYIDNWVINSQTAADYLLLASPDGLLFAYPYVADGYDFDTRETIAAADRRVTATLSSGTTLTASGTSWSTTRYGLKGTVVAARDANGLTYTGIITANTGTTLTVAWLGGRTPPNGSLTITIGGVDAFVDTGWAQIDEEGRFGILRAFGVRSGSFKTQLAAVIRTAKSASRILGNAVATQHTLPVGKGFEQIRRQCSRGGHYHQFRLGTITDGQLWEVSALELDIEQTGSMT